MRTRSVAVLLSAAVALGIGIDLANDAGGRPEPAFVRTDHTAPACPRPMPGADRGLKRHCHKRKPLRPPATRPPAQVAPSAKGGAR
jgi:hypothetical protein